MWVCTFQKWVRAQDSESHQFPHEWQNSEHFNWEASWVSQTQTILNPPHYPPQRKGKAHTPDFLTYVLDVPTPSARKESTDTNQNKQIYLDPSKSHTGSSGQSTVAPEFHDCQDWIFGTHHSPSYMKWYRESCQPLSPFCVSYTFDHFCQRSP